MIALNESAGAKNKYPKYPTCLVESFRTFTHIKGLLWQTCGVDRYEVSDMLVVCQIVADATYYGNLLRTMLHGQDGSPGSPGRSLQIPGFFLKRVERLRAC